MRQEYDRRRKVIYKGLCDMGLPVFEPKGAFYIFPSIVSTGYNSNDFAEELLKAEHVALVPGSAFGQCGEGHVRCSYATSIDKISEALNRIENFLTGSSVATLFSFVNFFIFGWILACYNPVILGIFLAGNTLYVCWVLVFMKYRRELDIRRFAQAAGEQSSLIQIRATKRG